MCKTNSIDTEILNAAMELSEEITTYFASPERSSHEEVARQTDILIRNDMLMTAFDAVPITLLILNNNRQIIGANSLTQEQFGDAFQDVFGKRPGEAFNCIHASNGPGGCGTAKACNSCGAVRAIVKCIDSGKKTSHECCLQARGKDGSIRCLDLKVTVSEFPVDGKSFYSLVIEDIAQSKRLEVFQQLFFHDILNTIGCIKGYVDIIQYSTPSYSPGQQVGDSESYILHHLASLCEQLNNEVTAHRELLSAENGELVVQREHVRTMDILHALAVHYQKLEIGQDHLIVILPSCNRMLVTDRLLLMRIMGNMLKNAIEASPPKSRITLQCTEENGQVVFLVNNPGVIPEEIWYQIFKRSFSTKQSVERGIGTYSMRLLGEQYLGGQVDFTSQEDTGTTFRFRLQSMPEQ